MSEGKNPVAYCGLYCNKCFSHEGRIADLARDLRKELRKAKFDKKAEGMSKISFFKSFENYSQCYEVLGTMVKLRCKTVCRDGGGNPFCKIRKCCEKKNIEGCWLCNEFETCNTLDFLRPIHGDEHIGNLKDICKKVLRVNK